LMSSTIPEIAVIDTHALIWWIDGDRRRIGRRALRFFDHVDEGRAVACIPTVALIELSESVHSGKVSLYRSFDAVLTGIRETPSRYQIVPLTGEIVARAHALFAIPERGDRLIAATAAELGYPIVTRDPAITGAIGADHVW
jgi:PIN domain nuclease of toxin-antitoxin system